MDLKTFDQLMKLESTKIYAAVGRILSSYAWVEGHYRDTVSVYMRANDEFHHYQIRLSAVSFMRATDEMIESKPKTHFSNHISHAGLMFDNLRRNRNAIAHSMAVLSAEDGSFLSSPDAQKPRGRRWNIQISDLVENIKDLNYFDQYLHDIKGALFTETYPDQPTIKKFLPLSKLPKPPLPKIFEGTHLHDPRSYPEHDQSSPE